MRAIRSTLSAALLIALIPTSAFAQDPPRVSREAMWPAPTAEDWAKPCLIRWQRTWDDAVAVAKETGKPILICVNMDGEVASEHYAGVRYRQPEVAALYEPYVCVIASTYRHNPRDYDEQGRRIPCPRFGTVTCGEHIRIEPILYEKFFDGRRIAPRHIMVELDGSETFDVMLTNDVASVFNAIRDGIVERKRKPLNIVRGDRPLTERVASRDSLDREAVEAGYAKGDATLRRSLLDAAGAQKGDVPLDLLRLAIFGLDTDLSRLARTALARSNSPDAIELISEALRVPMDTPEKDALIDALERLGKDSEKAKWLAGVFRGLAAGKGAVNAKAWSGAAPRPAAPRAPESLGEAEARRQYVEEAARKDPEDPDLLISLAEASLDLARRARTTRAFDPRLSKGMARHMYADALRLAEQAGKHDAPDWRVETVRTIVAYYRGETEEAYRHAARTVREMPPGEPSWNSMAVLTIFAEGRWMRLKAAARAGRRWPSHWLADIDSAYAALLHHPYGTPEQVVWHHDLMIWLGVADRGIRVLEAGLQRFPDSPLLHRKLREILVKERGVRALEGAYDRMLAAKDPHPNLSWYAGYASARAAEIHRRGRRPEKALAAYDRAIGLFETAAEANPHAKRSADIHVALALAGKARIHYEAKEDEEAVAAMAASLDRAPGAAATRDGMGITPADTARMLMARLVEEKRTDLIARLETATGKVDPELLAPRDNLPPDLEPRRND